MTRPVTNEGVVLSQQTGDNREGAGLARLTIFSSIAALGAGLDVAVEQTAGHIRASPTAVAYAVAVPIGVFVLALSAVQAWIFETSVLQWRVVLGWEAVILVVPLATPWTETAVIIAALTTAGVLLTASTVLQARTRTVRHVVDAGRAAPA